MDKIKELLIVEGQHDIDRLKQFFDCDVVATHGLGLDEEKLKLIKTLALNRQVVVLTDPDHPGELIRQKLIAELGSCGQAFIPKDQAVGKRNLGVEYASKQAIETALAQAVTFKPGTQSLSWEEFLRLGTIGNSDRRAQICQAFNLGHANNKTLYKRLNMVGASYTQIVKKVDGND